MAESEEEDQKVVGEIEDDYKKIIEAERDDKTALKKTVTRKEKEISELEKENDLIKTQTATNFSAAAPRERRKSTKKAFELPEYDVEVETASMDDLKKMIREAQEKIAERDQDI